jgi:hypothetical protein
MTFPDVVVTYVILSGIFILAVILYGCWRGIVQLWSALLNGAAQEIE